MDPLHDVTREVLDQLKDIWRRYAASGGGQTGNVLQEAQQGALQELTSIASRLGEFESAAGLTAHVSMFVDPMQHLTAVPVGGAILVTDALRSARDVLEVAARRVEACCPASGPVNVEQATQHADFVRGALLVLLTAGAAAQRVMVAVARGLVRLSARVGGGGGSMPTRQLRDILLDELASPPLATAVAAAVGALQRALQRGGKAAAAGGGDRDSSGGTGGGGSGGSSSSVPFLGVLSKASRYCHGLVWSACFIVDPQYEQGGGSANERGGGGGGRETGAQVATRRMLEALDKSGLMELLPEVLLGLPPPPPEACAAAAAAAAAASPSLVTVSTASLEMYARERHMTVAFANAANTLCVLCHLVTNMGLDMYPAPGGTPRLHPTPLARRVMRVLLGRNSQRLMRALLERFCLDQEWPAAPAAAPASAAPASAAAVAAATAAAAAAGSGRGATAAAAAASQGGGSSCGWPLLDGLRMHDLVSREFIQPFGDGGMATSFEVEEHARQAEEVVYVAMLQPALYTWALAEQLGEGIARGGDAGRSGAGVAAGAMPRPPVVMDYAVRAMRAVCMAYRPEGRSKPRAATFMFKGTHLLLTTGTLVRLILARLPALVPAGLDAMGWTLVAAVDDAEHGRLELAALGMRLYHGASDRGTTWMRPVLDTLGGMKWATVGDEEEAPRTLIQPKHRAEVLVRLSATGWFRTLDTTLRLAGSLDQPDERDEACHCAAILLLALAPPAAVLRVAALEAAGGGGGAAASAAAVPSSSRAAGSAAARGVTAGAGPLPAVEEVVRDVVGLLVTLGKGCARMGHRFEGKSVTRVDNEEVDAPANDFDGLIQAIKVMVSELLVVVGETQGSAAAAAGAAARGRGGGGDSSSGSDYEHAGRGGGGGGGGNGGGCSFRERHPDEAEELRGAAVYCVRAACHGAAFRLAFAEREIAAQKKRLERVQGQRAAAREAEKLLADLVENALRVATTCAEWLAPLALLLPAPRQLLPAAPQRLLSAAVRVLVVAASVTSVGREREKSIRVCARVIAGVLAVLAAHKGISGDVRGWLQQEGAGGLAGDVAALRRVLETQGLASEAQWCERLVAAARGERSAQEQQREQQQGCRGDAAAAFLRCARELSAAVRGQCATLGGEGGGGEEEHDDEEDAGVALPRACGNPRCTNFSCATEGDLKLRRCSGCKEFRYCSLEGAASSECQKEHWREAHKGECGRG